MTHWGYWSDAGVRPRSSLRRRRSACLPGEGRTAGIGHDVHRGQPQRARARSRGDRPAQPLDHSRVRTWPPRVESAAGQARGGRPCRCAMSTAPRKTATAAWSRCAPCQPADSRPIAASAVKCPGRSQIAASASSRFSITRISDSFSWTMQSTWATTAFGRPPHRPDLPAAAKWSPARKIVIHAKLCADERPGDD